MIIFFNRSAKNAARFEYDLKKMLHSGPCVPKSLLLSEAVVLHQATTCKWLWPRQFPLCVWGSMRCAPSFFPTLFTSEKVLVEMHCALFVVSFLITYVSFFDFPSIIFSMLRNGKFFCNSLFVQQAGLP